MRAWWLSRTPQDRLAIAGAAGAVLLLLIYLLGWLPLQQKIEQAHQRVVGQRATLQWMRERAAEAVRLRASQGPQAHGKRREALLTLVDRTAKQHKLRQQIQRLKPQGSDGVHIWLEQASFDALIKWLGELSTRFGVGVESLNIERLDAPGRVNARLRLQRGSS